MGNTKQERGNIALGRSFKPIRTRKERLHGLAAVAKSWLEFTKRLSPSESGPDKSVEDLHVEYLYMIDRTTDHKEQMDIGKGKRRFVSIW